MLDGDRNFEHPFPRWLQRFAGDVGERRSSAFPGDFELAPTWRQMELSAHSVCNTLFARHLEERVRNSVITMVNGGVISGDQMDVVLDWLDKIRSSAAHMATAFTGHSQVLGYRDEDFPNQRIGLSDRVAYFYRVDDQTDELNIWEIFDEAFLSTPSALIIKIKSLIIVTVSSATLLSAAFGLDEISFNDGNINVISGSGRFSGCFGSRITRIPMGVVVAQAMRRHLLRGTSHAAASSLKPNGDGHLYRLIAGRWERARSFDFGRLPTLGAPLAYRLAELEVIEWLILIKQRDFARAGKPAGYFAMNSLDSLRLAKALCLDAIARHRAGLRPEENDRI